MNHQHLSARLLQEIAEEQTPKLSLHATIEHLNSCARCGGLLDEVSPGVRLFFEQLMEGREERPRYTPDSYAIALDSVYRRVAQESSQLDSERRSAPLLLKDLDRLEVGGQELLVRNSERFQGWGFAEYLLEQSRNGWTEDPVRSEHLATLAFQISLSIRADGIREKILNDLRAEAWSYVGNCRRILSDFHAAADAFERGEQFLERGTGDPMERARLLDLKASYLRATRRFSDAKRLLDEVVTAYRLAGESLLEAKALLGLSKLLNDTGEVGECLPLVERAIAVLGPEGDAWMRFIAEVQVLHSLYDVGREHEAQRRLPRARELAHQVGSRLDRLRLLWIEGLICRSLGKKELAEEALKQVRAGFIDAEIGYDVALVSLDLAALYLETGRTAEVKELAAEMLPQFAARQIHREALAAIALFEQAARKERATLALVQEISSKVKDASTRRTPPENG